MASCVVCGCEDLRRDNPPLLVCCRCGHGFRPFAGDTIAYHRETFRREHIRGPSEIADDGHILEQFHKNRSVIVERRIKRTMRFLRQCSTALDVGAGAGTFARAMRELVPDIDAIEVEPHLVTECRALGFPTEEVGLLEFVPKRSYDVVTAWHVLEHIEDPVAAATALKGLFRKYLILEIPIDRRVPEKFDGHHHYFSHESFQLLFSDLCVEVYTHGIQAPALFAVYRHRIDYSQRG